MGGQTFQEDRLGPHIVQIRSEVPQIGVVADLDSMTSMSGSVDAYRFRA